MKHQPYTLSVADFASTFSIGKTRIYELIASGELTPVKIGGKTLLEYESGVALIERHRRPKDRHPNVAPRIDEKAA